MSAPAFHETREGKTFFGRDVPAFIKAVERIATALETIAAQNERDVESKQVSRRQVAKALKYAVSSHAEWDGEAENPDTQDTNNPKSK